MISLITRNWRKFTALATGLWIGVGIASAEVLNFTEAEANIIAAMGLLETVFIAFFDLVMTMLPYIVVFAVFAVIATICSLFPKVFNTILGMLTGGMRHRK